jgi:transposase InsO family protein
LISIDKPTGSSRSARSCRLPRQRVGATPRWCASLISAAPEPSATRCRCRRFNASGRPNAGLWRRQSVVPTGTRRCDSGPLYGRAADALHGAAWCDAWQGRAHHIGDAKTPCPLDRVNRQLRAERPNQLWVSDFTYVSTSCREGVGAWRRANSMEMSSRRSLWQIPWSPVQHRRSPETNEYLNDLRRYA